MLKTIVLHGKEYRFQLRKTRHNSSDPIARDGLIEVFDTLNNKPIVGDLLEDVEDIYPPLLQSWVDMVDLMNDLNEKATNHA